MIETEYAWSAGFMDGEGYTGLTKDGYPYVHIAQIVKEPLLRLQGLFGGKIHGPYPGKRDNWSEQWYWRVSGKYAVQEFIEHLRPYMSKFKLEQADKVLSEAKWVPAPGMCRKGLHVRAGDNLTPDGRCRECRNASHLASWNRRKQH